MKADDPNVIAAKKAMEKLADKNIENVTGKSVMDGMNSRTARWNPFGQDYSPASEAPGETLGALREDYATAYRYQFGQTGNATAADDYAKEIIGRKYTFSPANEGRLTAFAPETSDAYPNVNGNKDYIGAQLNDFMAANGHPGARGYLVPDGNTEAESKSGRPPGYGVVAQGNDGMFHAVTGRFYADPKAAMQRATQDFETASRPSWQGGSLWGRAQ